ncbi:MAG: hypothetical protein M0021_09745 [Clostridia bacterium]|nr:hypothetical protein [Clostridia bacterium]
MSDYTRPTIHIRSNLDEQIKSRGSRSTVISRDLERLYTLYRRALAEVKLTIDEACLIVDALNGSLMDANTARLLWANIADAVSMDGLDEKWSVDGPALVEKLRGLSDIQALAVVDAAERFWQGPYRETDIYEAVEECFLV